MCVWGGSDKSQFPKQKKGKKYQYTYCSTVGNREATEGRTFSGATRKCNLFSPLLLVRLVVVVVVAAIKGCLLPAVPEYKHTLNE